MRPDIATVADAVARALEQNRPGESGRIRRIGQHLSATASGAIDHSMCVLHEYAKQRKKVPMNSHFRRCKSLKLSQSGRRGIVFRRAAATASKLQAWWAQCP